LSFESPLVEAFSVPLLGAVSSRRDGEPSAVPPESKEHEQTGNGGLAGTWEVLTVPRNREVWGSRAQAEDPWPVTWVSGVMRSEEQDAAVVLPSEGNEAERNGRQEVLAPS
jgi:hypothetical protein